MRSTEQRPYSSSQDEVTNALSRLEIGVPNPNSPECTGEHYETRRRGSHNLVPAPDGGRTSSVLHNPCSGKKGKRHKPDPTRITAGTKYRDDELDPREIFQFSRFAELIAI